MAEHTQIHTSETKHNNIISPQLAKSTETQKPDFLSIKQSKIIHNLKETTMTMTIATAVANIM